MRLTESHRTKKNVVLHDAPQPDTLSPHDFLYTNAADAFFGVSRIHTIYLYMHCFPNRSLAALLANAKHRTECHRT